MEGRRRRSFTEDYKRQAVEILISSGRPVASVAKELGLLLTPGPSDQGGRPLVRYQH